MIVLYVNNYTHGKGAKLVDIYICQINMAGVFARRNYVLN